MAMLMPTVTEIPIVRVSEPYVDPRRVRSTRPYAVTVMAGRTGRLVQTRRFASPRAAWNFYREQTR
jgi:hypothetical protein